MSVGKRLIEERERLQLSQSAFFNACGVSKKAQYNFENDEQLPGAAYLIAADALGVDILYVLTGRKGAPRKHSGDTAYASGGSISVAGSNNTVTGNTTNAPSRRKK